MAVLVNRYSASASEIFAAAIQDYGRGLIIGEPTFGKGTVQSLLDLDDYAPADAPSMGQLKITMAQFFRVNGGSTQNRGVEPDIRFPSAGDPQKYGERSLANALPWTSIDPARYQTRGDLSELAAVAGDRFARRRDADREFNWLMSDIDEFNRKSDRTSVSLLETTARQEMEQAEAKRQERKDKLDGASPLVNSDDVLIEDDPESFEDETAVVEESAAADEGPDLLLRETARIVADMAELQADRDLLKRQFTQIHKNQPPAPQLN
jgi:carboxyl-terminal processing protease